MKKTIVALSIFTILNAFAGDGHNHEAAVEPAPHGGTLRDAKPYKAELVLNGDEAKIYMYDANVKPATLSATEMKGKLRFPKQKKESEVIFKKTGEAFVTILKGVSKVHRYDLHVNFEQDGKKILIDFGVDNIH